MILKIIIKLIQFSIQYKNSQINLIIYFNSITDSYLIQVRIDKQKALKTNYVVL